MSDGDGQVIELFVENKSEKMKECAAQLVDATTLLAEISEFFAETGQGFMSSCDTRSYALHKRIYELLWPDMVNEVFDE